jgi:hypothetical protein
MTYYVTAVNKETHDEWVISTHDTALEATTKCDEYKSNDPGFDYRVDIANVERGHITAYAKLALNSLYGKYADTDSVRTEDYQLTELFGWYEGTAAADRIINCLVCGAVVSYDNKFMNLHQEFHNKLLP